ncbi:hypothetical protein GJR93_31605 [Aminobacter sp. MDW-2]|nr:hypothetical protein [Aminobacter sp. MDW-2]
MDRTDVQLNLVSGFRRALWFAVADCACTIVASSLIPRKPGDRVKTNRRDAICLNGWGGGEGL